jgi:phosphate transport system substrate-binding protein
MNDEFLHRLRAQPPPRFAARLKSRLAALPSGMAHRSPALRNVLVALMLGGAAFAVTAISIRGVPPVLLNFIRGEPSATELSPPRSSILRSEARPNGSAASGRASTPRRLTPSRAPTERVQPLTGNESSPSARPSASASDSSSAAGATVRASTAEAIRVAVSSATLPLAEAVASQLHAVQLAVKIEVLGDQAALTALCAAGSGFSTVIVSRRMTRQEFELCHLNSVVPTHEAVVGRQAVVLAQSIGGPELRLTTRELFLALAKLTPRADDPRLLVGNQATMWWQIGVDWGYQQIQVLGPPLDSVAGNALIEVLMDGGCRAHPALRQMLKADSPRFDSVCRSVREDGIYLNFGVNQKAIEQKVRISPGAIGLFSYAFFDANREGLTALTIDGVAPSAETIASGAYPGSRVLYVYVKRHSRLVRAGADPFVMELQVMAESRTTLAAMGLVAPTDTELRLKPLSARDLQP